MSVSYYDKAMLEKVQGWVKDKNTRVLGPDESLRTFQIAADINRDTRLTLPLISISRSSNVEISVTHKKPMSFDGFMIAHPEPPEGVDPKKWYDELYAKEKAKSLQVNAIPIVLNYQLDIYAKELKTIDEFVRNFTFNFINHPKLKLVLPYNGTNYVHECNVEVVSPIQDNSDIPSRLFAGQFYRWTISLIINDAYLFSVPVENLVKIDDYNVISIRDYETEQDSVNPEAAQEE